MKTLSTLLVLTVLLASPTLALAAETDEPAHPDVNAAEMAEIERGDRPATDPVAGVTRLPAESVVELTPMQQEIRVVLEDHDRELEKLQAELATATDERQALEIQKKIHELKQSVEPAVLNIQLRHARAKGHDEAVAGLEAALEALESPDVRGRPIDRAAPDGREQ